MSYKNHNQFGDMHKTSPIQAYPTQNGGYENIQLATRRSVQRPSIVEPPDLNEVKKSSTTHNGVEYDLIPVEIEKDAEIGLVLGQIEGEQWSFIDEILPNGMIDVHGILKEGDYLIQAGSFSLAGIDITTALVLVERAYEEGRKSVAFVAARAQKPDAPSNEKKNGSNRRPPPYEDKRRGSRAQSFVEYENAEEEEEEQPKNTKPNYSRHKEEIDETRF